MTARQTDKQAGEYMDLHANRQIAKETKTHRRVKYTNRQTLIDRKQNLKTDFNIKVAGFCR